MTRRDSTNATARVWIMSFIAWTCLGALTNLTVELGYTRENERFAPEWWTRMMVYWIAYAPATPLLLRTATFIRFEALKEAPIVLLASTAFVSSHTLILAILGWTLGPDSWFDRYAAESLAETVLTTWKALWPLDFLVAALSLASFMLFLNTRRARTKEIEALALSEQLAEARLSALKSQLQPHFLFNTLHAIGVFARRDPERAGTMIAQLGDLLRMTLDERGSQEVTLRDECSVLDRYLDIQRTRFSGRLQTTFDLDPDSLDCLVPHLILQPLVENSIRHGIEARAGTGHVTVSSSFEEGRLKITVTDNGKGFDDADPSENGIGLGSTRKRLALLYGEDHRLEIASTPNGGGRVSVRIPRRSSRDE